MTQATDKVLQLLHDGEWHPLSELVDAIAPMMAPGPAYRRMELGRKAAQRRRGAPVTTRQRGDEQTSIAAGQRVAARSVVRGLRRRGQVEERGERLNIEVRAIPGGSVP